MWVRNAVTVSSKLVGGRGTNSLFRVCGFSPISHHRGGCFRANSTSSAGDLVNWAQSGADAQFSGRRLTSSVSASFIDAADSSLKAKEILEMAKNYGRCYWELSKARLSMLVVATSGTGYIMGSGSSVDYLGLCFTCAGTMMVAASANSLNQVFEVKNDALMNRTKNRPLPSGRITVPHALTWGSSVGLAGTALLASQANMLAAGLAASNLVLYAFVYTPLKQIHPVNTWIGAVVGAIPPLLGWVAACGDISLSAMILPAALYFWQIPHFMALAYLCRHDYANGGFKMISLGDPSGVRTAMIALRNCVYLVPLGYFAYHWGLTSGWFCGESTALAAAISYTAASFYMKRTSENARRMFRGSLVYLPVFMGGLLVHRVGDDGAAAFEEERSSSPSSSFVGKEVRSPYRPPPVAYASVAPFPFLPAPSYAGC